MLTTKVFPGLTTLIPLHVHGTDSNQPWSVHCLPAGNIVRPLSGSDPVTHDGMQLLFGDRLSMPNRTGMPVPCPALSSRQTNFPMKTICAEDRRRRSAGPEYRLRS